METIVFENLLTKAKIYVIIFVYDKSDILRYAIWYKNYGGQLMFVKLTTVKSGKKRVEITYIRLLEKYRGKDGKFHERAVANLGRMDIEGRTNITRLLKSLRRFSDEILVTPEEIESKAALEYGQLLVCRKLWNEIGLGEWIRESCGRVAKYSLGESGVLAMVLNRLISPGSELGLCRWLETVYLEEFDNRFRDGDTKRRADRFYSTLDWLIKGKERIEEKVYFWIRTLFPVDVVFYDITNVQFEGKGPAMSRIGYARLGKRNHKQVLLGIIMIEGLPVAHYVFRGNQAEKKTLSWITKEVKKKYNVGRIIFVVDRGMITVTNLEEIAKEDGYIVAIRRRKDEEAKELLESGNDGFIEIKENLFAKEVKIDMSKKNKNKRSKDIKNVVVNDTEIDDKRRVVCLNPEKAKEQKAKRESIMTELEHQLVELKEKADNGKVKNQKVITSSAERILNKKHGKRYFDYKVGEGKFEYWQKKENIDYEEKLDGKFMIKTTEKDLTLKEIVLRYKDLSNIEGCFRDIKDFIEVAPVYHFLNRRVRAHIFVGVLALLVQRYMEKKLDNAKLEISSERVLEKLKAIHVVINQVKHLCLKYVTPPSKELEQILRVFGIPKLPKMLSDISKDTVPGEKRDNLMVENGFR